MVNHPVITKLGQPSYAVRLHAAGERKFFASFNLTELDGGQTLAVSNFIARDGSSPPGVHWFRDFAAEHFPRGERITWTDVDGCQSTYRFNPSLLERIAEAACVGISR